VSHPHRQIALLGGSFNPPHFGHLMAALFVRGALPVDEVWLMPAYHHPFGKPLEGFEHRVQMCRAMASDLGPWLKVSEVEREVGEGGRTIDTLEYLLPRHPDTRFRLIIGSDILHDLPNWKAWDRIQGLVDITVLYRAGYPDPRAIGPPLAEVSSSEIRKRLEAKDLPHDLIPRAVLVYIQARHLYGL
jgi:nicotinate-nucleotide adenylyltransferase